MSIPGTAYQLVVLLVLVMPGIVYAAARGRLRGPGPDDRDASVRVLRAMMISAALDTLYVVALGPHFLALHRDRGPRAGQQGWALHSRELAAWAFLLLFLLPALLAFVLHGLNWEPVKGSRWKHRAKRHRSYHPTPTAWDYAAPPHLGGCFVRIRLVDGRFVGGWLGDNSFVSSYPEARDIFIDRQWRLDAAGTMLRPLERTLGVYVNLEGAQLVEWVSGPQETAVDSSTGSVTKSPPATLGQGEEQHRVGREGVGDA